MKAKSISALVIDSLGFAGGQIESGIGTLFSFWGKDVSIELVDAFSNGEMTFSAGLASDGLDIEATKCPAREVCCCDKPFIASI